MRRKRLPAQRMRKFLPSDGAPSLSLTEAGRPCMSHVTAADPRSVLLRLSKIFHFHFAIFSHSSFTSATFSPAFSFHSAMTFSAFSFAMVARASLADFNPRAAPSV